MLMEEARRAGVEKFVAGRAPICAYPKFTPVPFHEDDLWNGYPEETNAPYGIAKKALLVQARRTGSSTGSTSIYLLPVNLYGPRDNFDLETSHVIPALIRKCVEARSAATSEVVLWGDGSRHARVPVRGRRGARHGARARALRRPRAGEPRQRPRDEHSAQLAELVAKATGFTGAIRWDTSKPNGQPRRCLDVSRARERFGFEAKMPFDEGLRRTVAWHRSARAEVG